MRRIVNSCTLKIRGGVERDANGKKAGKGPLIQWEKSATLGVSQDQTLFVFKGGATSLNVNGSGWRMNASFTLNATDVHGIAYEIHDDREPSCRQQSEHRR